MKFIVIMKQNGEGCDYTIGCGMTYCEVEASSYEDAKDKVLYEDIDEDDGYSGALDDGSEQQLKEMLIVKVDDVHVADLQSEKDVYMFAREAAKLKKAAEKEMAKLAELRAKYG